MNLHDFMFAFLPSYQDILCIRWKTEALKNLVYILK